MLKGPLSLCRVWPLWFFFFWVMALGADDTIVHAFLNDSPKLAVNNGTVQEGTRAANHADSLREIVDEAKRFAAAGNIDQAIEKYTDAINKSPQDPVLYFERGTLYYRHVAARSSTEAQLAISSPVETTAPGPETTPYPAENPFSTPVALCGLALSDFDQAIALNSKYAIFFYMRGVLLTLEACPHRNLEAATADFDQALRLNPANAAFYQERGITRGKLGQFDQAMRDIDQAILIEPHNYYFLYEKGMIQEKMGKHEDAAANYMQALFFAPPDQMMLLISALKKARNHNSRVLIADFDSLIARRPAVSAFYIQRGILFADGKKWEKAIDDYSSALSLQGSDIEILFMRGKLFLEAGKKQDALKDFQSACRLHHNAACNYAQNTENQIARGDRWIPFWYSRDNREYFYDRQYLKNQQGRLRVVRVRVEANDVKDDNSISLDNDTKENNRRDYTLEWWEFKCSSAQFRIAKLRRFNAEGQLVESYPEFEKSFHPVLPDGVSDKLARIVCGNSGGRKPMKKTNTSRREKPIYSP